MILFSKRIFAPAILAVAAWLCGNAALAQSFPSIAPPPVHETVDANGVDLIQGVYNYKEPTLSIGTSGNGLSRSVVLGVDNYTGTINVSGSDYYVSYAGATEHFTRNGSVYTNASGTASTFINGSVYTMADGTVAYFNTGLTGSSRYQANGGVISSLQKPNGEQLVFTYGSISYQAAGMPYAAPGIRLQAVVSNLGWMLKYDYVTTANPTTNGADFSGWLSLLKVTAINTAVEPNYCNPASNGCTTQYTWPYVSYPSGSATQVVDALGRATTTSRTGVTLPSGVHLTVAYDSSNRVSSVSNGSATWTYAYSDSNGIRTTTATDPLGHTRVVVSNLSTLLSTSDTDALSHTTSYAYDSYGRITQVTRPEGDATQYAYDARGNITTVTQVAKPGSGLANIVTSASYDSTCTYTVKCNKPNSTTDARGKVTSYTYDTSMGAVLTVTQPTTVSGTSPQVRYSYAQVPTYSVNSSGALAQSGTIWTLTQTSTCRTQNSCSGTSDETRTTISYNSATNLFPVSTIVAAGDGSISETTSQTYDAVGNVLTKTDALGNVTRTRYDLARQVLGGVAADPDGSGPLLNRAVRYTYSTDGLVTLVEKGTVNSQSDADWANFNSLQQVVTTYDGLDRVSTQTLTSGGAKFSLTQKSYDAANRVTCVAQRMNAAAFSSLPASACTAGTAGSDGPDRITSYGYDNDNRVIQATSAYGTSAASTVTTSFGSNGETISVVDGKNNLTAFSYDGFNRLIQTNYPSPTTGAGASNSADYQTLSYDTGGNVVSIRRRDGQTVSIAYDNLSRPVNDMTGASYVYDNPGNVTSVAANSQTLTASYDALGRQSYQSGPLGMVSYLYYNLNRRTRMTWPDGFYVNYAYDAVSELTGITDSTGTTVTNYAYDNLSRRTGITRGNGVSTAYNYDSFSNLTGLSQSLSNSGQNQSYTLGYNAGGQIKSLVSSNDNFAYPASAMNRAYGINGLNQATASGSLTVSYDGRGNVSSDGVNTYAYDVANRLTSMSNGATLSYDPLSRLSKTVGSTTTQFLYDGTDLIGEYDSSGAVLIRYVHGPGADETIYSYDKYGNRAWLLANAQGSIIATTNASGVTPTNNAGAMIVNAYDEYGLPGSNNSGRFQYTGQMWIPEIGMYNYKARIYSPGFGRFLQTDPIGYGDGPNWYAYVHGDPVNGRDPSGQQCVWDDGSFDSLDGSDSVTTASDCGNAGGSWVDPIKFEKAGISSEAWTAEGSGLSWLVGSILNINPILASSPEDGYSTYADYSIMCGGGQPTGGSSGGWIGGSAEAGILSVGGAVQAQYSRMGFSNNVTADYTTFGWFFGGPGYGAAYPSTPSGMSSTHGGAVMGFAFGGGGGLAFSNAKQPGDLTGISTSWNANVGFVSGSLSLGDNGIYTFNIGLSKGDGLDFSEYATNTTLNGIHLRPGC